MTDETHLSPHAQRAVEAEQAAMAAAVQEAQLAYLAQRVHALAVELAEERHGGEA